MFIPIIIILLSLTACLENQINTEQEALDPKFEKYWYQGEAEITSYELKQARYGEIREGTSVLIFVTEPFSKSSMTKADNPQKGDPSVLKLNMTKKFNTGIYPYSMMTSTFLPVENPLHSLKISSSSQEWCGHSYTELHNKKQFEINTSSYFESESSSIKIEKNLLEDDVWSLIRINPEKLKIGKSKMLPSLFYLGLTHKEKKAYNVILSKEDDKNGSSIYTMEYPELDRTLAITFDSNFPHQITSWEESAYSGYGADKKKLVTTASKMKSLKSDYWNKKNNKDAYLRKELGL